MLNLPVEIRRRCMDFVDDKTTLKSVRLVNNELCTLASEALFRTAVLYNEDTSAERFTRLFESPLCRLIRRVSIHTLDEPEYPGDGQTEVDVEESFIEAIGRLTLIENLEEVELNFGQECACEEENDYGLDKEIAEPVDFRTEVLEPFFAALAQAAKVKSLSVLNLQDHMPQEIFESENFKIVRGRLTKLALQITTESNDASPENSIHIPACHRGFTRNLPDIWLKPMANQLTHLTIYGAECFWGIWPFTDFREIPPFSRLKSLSLGNFTIVHDWQIDWILAHAPTLEELLLDDSPIIIALKMERDHAKQNFPDLKPYGTQPDTYAGRLYYAETEMRWHQVLDRFRVGLPLLQRFALGSGNWSDSCAFRERYTLENRIDYRNYYTFDIGIGPTQWQSMGSRYDGGKEERHLLMGKDDRKRVEISDCLEEDQTALDALIDALQRRVRVG